MASERSSLADVAAQAGLSLATVSRVLSNKDHPISQKTRDRVLRVAEEIGYTPNAIARALATNVNQTIGIIVGDITDTYFAEIVRGAEDVAASEGYATVICNGERNPARELRYFRTLMAQNSAAILLAGGNYPNLPQTEELATAIVKAGAQHRVICLAERGVPGTAVIQVDSRAVFYDLTSYVIGLGHRRIAFIGGPPGFSISDDFKEGFEAAMNKAQLDPSLQLPGGFGLEYGRAGAIALLGRSLPDAVVCGSDDTSIGLIATFIKAGVNVPAGISIAGVDDAKYSELLNLTTVSLPLYELGASGARAALGLDALGQGIRILPHRVVARGTTSNRGTKSAGPSPTNPGALFAVATAS